MRRISRVLIFGVLGCLLSCSALVILLVLGGVGLGTAIAEWRTCYRDPSFLATSCMAGVALLMIGTRSWRVRRTPRRVSLPSTVVPHTGKSSTPDVSIACTLVASDRKFRLEELAKLSQNDLAYARREDLTLHLRYRPEAEERVRQMVKKEQECCAFLVFDFEPHPIYLALRITAPEAARAAVQEIYAQFLTDRGALD